MKYQVYRGLRKILMAKVTIQEGGTEQWGTWEEVAGLQTAQVESSASEETIYFDNLPAIIITAEGATTYTLTMSVPSQEVRAKLDGRKWDSTKKAVLGTKVQKDYYAIGFVWGTNDGEEFITVALKGKWGGGSKSYATEDSGTTHNTVQYTFTAVSTKSPVTFNGGAEPMSGYTLPTGDGNEAKYLAVGSKPVTNLTT